MEQTLSTLKERIEKKYGSVNKFIDKKLIDCKGELPFTRTHLYKLINHEVPNPGIKTLSELSALVDEPLNIIIEEFVK